MNRLIGFVLGVLLFGALTGSAFAQKEGKPVRVLQANRVYYPARIVAKKNYKKVGLVDSRKIFDATPEYKEIARRSLKRTSAEYLLLAQKASERFKRAIKRTVSLKGYEVIAETGAITVEGKIIPNITSEVLGNLSGAK